MSLILDISDFIRQGKESIEIIEKARWLLPDLVSRWHIRFTSNDTNERQICNYKTLSGDLVRPTPHAPPHPINKTHQFLFAHDCYASHCDFPDLNDSTKWNWTMGWLLLEWSMFLEIKQKINENSKTKQIVYCLEVRNICFTNSWQHYFSITLLKYCSIAYHFPLISNNFSSACNAWS